MATTHPAWGATWLNLVGELEVPYAPGRAVAIDREVSFGGVPARITALVTVLQRDR